MRSSRIYETLASAVRHWKGRIIGSTKWTPLHDQDQKVQIKKRPSSWLKILIFFLFCVLLLSCILLWIHVGKTEDEISMDNSSLYAARIQHLRTTYPPSNYTLETPSLTFMLHDCVAGFGSYTNNALSLFLISLDYNLSFHIQSLNWCYGSWSTFFNDYSSNSSSPIVLDDLPAYKAEGQLKDISNPDFKGHIFIEHSAENFDEFYHQLAPNIKGHVLERKQIAAQALWSPKPLITDVVRDIQAYYIQAPKKVFFSMHIRRGDKLKYEMASIATSLYADKVLYLATTKYPGRDIALFVFADDDEPVYELQSLLATQSNIEIFTLVDAFTHLSNLSESWSPHKQHVGYDQIKFSTADESYRFQQSAELITDITLAASADEFICTYSSNIARLVTLLRTKPMNTIHSLDWSSWNNW